MREKSSKDCTNISTTAILHHGLRPGVGERGRKLLQEAQGHVHRPDAHDAIVQLLRDTRRGHTEVTAVSSGLEVGGGNGDKNGNPRSHKQHMPQQRQQQSET